MWQNVEAYRALEMSVRLGVREVALMSGQAENITPAVYSICCMTIAKRQAARHVYVMPCIAAMRFVAGENVA